MERADDGGRVNIRDIVLYLAEPLYILVQTLASLLGSDMQVACFAMGLVTSSKGAHKLMAQIRPGGNRVYRQVHQPRHGVGFKNQWKVIRKNLILAGSGGLHRDGVDAEELRRVSLCWKYALEAIINWLLLYFLVHDNRLLSMLELY